MNYSLFIKRTSRRNGFTLVELMVSTGLIALLMLLLLGTVDQTQTVWKRTTAKVAQFQASRAAFEAMNRRLSQATLNTYYRATDSNSTLAAAELLFRRQSELQFISGNLSDATTASGKIPGIFTASPSISGLTRPTERAYPTQGVFFFAPIGITEEPGLGDFKATRRFRGLDAMLTACGYFVEYGDDPWRPKVLPLATETDPGVPPRIRFRLMELSVPAEELMIYKRAEKVGGNEIDPTRTIPASPATPTRPATQQITVKWLYSVTPQVLNRTLGHYIGRTTTPNSARPDDIKSNPTWVRPFWMESTGSGPDANGGALQRTSLNATNSTNRFAYGRVMADNVIALVILPKLSEKDRDPAAPDKIGTLAPEYQYDSWRVLKKDAGTVGDANSVRDNKLPPIVQVIMVAIDETSAVRLSTSSVPDWTIRDKQLFTKVDKEADLLADLALLEKRLQDDKVNYRVFSTDVVIRSSKWSKDPVKN